MPSLGKVIAKNIKRRKKQGTATKKTTAIVKHTIARMAEKKYVDLITGQILVSTTPSIRTLNQAQNLVGRDALVGERWRNRWLNINMFFQPSNDAGVATAKELMNEFRVIIWRTYEQRQSATSVIPIGNGAVGTMAQYNIDHMNEYKIYFDKTYCISSYNSGNPCIAVHKFIKLGDFVSQVKIGAVAGSLVDFEANPLQIAVVSNYTNADAGRPRAYFDARVAVTDF